MRELARVGCIIAAVSGAAAIAGCQTRPPIQAARTPGEEAMSPDEARNRYVYRQRCGGCHGPNGEGVPEVGPEIRPRLARLGEAALTKRINEGGEQMPAFRGKLRPEQMEWLLAHLRKLRGKS